MEATKRKITAETVLAWLERSQEIKKEKQRQFQEDCRSGKVQEKLKNAKRAF
jgi:hypothetical protein